MASSLRKSQNRSISCQNCSCQFKDGTKIMECLTQAIFVAFSYCPLNDADIPTVKHLKKKRSSAGRLAGGKNLRSEAGFGGYVSTGANGNGGSLGVVDPSIIAIGPKGGKKGWLPDSNSLSYYITVSHSSLRCTASIVSFIVFLLIVSFPGLIVILVPTVISCPHCDTFPVLIVILVPTVILTLSF